MPTPIVKVPRGRLRRFFCKHADEYQRVAELSDGSRTMNIICHLLANPLFDQQEVADHFGVGYQYISQLMRDVEEFGSPTAYAQAKHDGRAVTRSRAVGKHVHRDPTSKRSVAIRVLSEEQRAQASAIADAHDESLKACTRAAILLALHNNLDKTYKDVANMLTAELGRTVHVHDVCNTLYTLRFTGSVNATCHGRLYASRRQYEEDLRRIEAINAGDQTRRGRGRPRSKV